MFSNGYPYTDFHEMNLDWIIDEFKKVHQELVDTKLYVDNGKLYIDGKLADATYQAELATLAKTASENAQASAESARDAASGSATAAAGSATAAAGSATQAAQTVANTLSQIALLQSRVDNIIPDGTQTEGNTELLDIRVEADGTIASSAGNSVRQQVTGLTNGLKMDIKIQNDILDIIENKETELSFIWENGHIDATTGKNVPSGVNQRVASYIPLYNKTFYVNSTSSDVTVYIFEYDADFTFLEVHGTSGTNNLSPVNSSTKYVRLSTWSSTVSQSDLHTYVRAYITNDNNITAIDDKTNVTDTALLYYLDGNYDFVSLNLFTTNQYLNSSGSISTGGGDNYLVTDYIPVIPGEKIYVHSLTDYSQRSIAFYDIYKNVVGVYPENPQDNTRLMDEEITVPYNCYYTILSFRTGTADSYFKRMKVKPIDKIWANKKWYVLGDSLTEENAKATKHYYDYVSELTGIQFTIDGIGGSGYARRHQNNESFYDRISNITNDYDVVTIFGSLNDGDAGLNLGTASDTGFSTVAGYITETLNTFITNHPLIPIGVVAPTPWDWLSPTSSNAFGRQYVQVLKEICERKSIPFLDLFYESNLHPDIESCRLATYSHDNGNGTHPDENGHKILAPKFQAFLDTLI